MSAAQYARLVSKKFRTPKLPKINRKMRPRVLAWAGPAAFYPNRFYEMDKWYKARIDKPQELPNLHIIEPTEHSRSLEQILAKNDSNRVNIGFAPRPKRKAAVRSDEDKARLERAARKKELLVDLDAVADGDSRIFLHSGLYDDLFGEPVFFERVQGFSASFGDHAVYTGNVLLAADTVPQPEVEIEPLGAGGLNTLLVLNVDGNAWESERRGELLHWLVANIPDGKTVAEGEEMVPWMQALPFLGTGYHRLAFLLFRHSAPINLDAIGASLEDRIFSTADFYKKHEESMTPSSLLFSQVHYDLSVKSRLHSLGLPSPLYEYEWTPPSRRPQKEFPKKAMPFDLYLDQYRDPKELSAEILTERLERFGLSESTTPRILDANFNENKKNLEPWLHARILSKNGRQAGVYKNALKY